jgi:hypothetical protein
LTQRAAGEQSLEPERVMYALALRVSQGAVVQPESHPSCGQLMSKGARKPLQKASARKAATTSTQVSKRVCAAHAASVYSTPPHVRSVTRLHSLIS